jgi:hypothetical protein
MPYRYIVATTDSGCKRLSDREVYGAWLIIAAQTFDWKI